MDLMLLIAACVPGIAAPTLAAVVAHESAGNPNAINLNSRLARISRVPGTRAEAEHVLAQLADGRHGTYDIGLGQINSVHLARLDLNAQALLDPCLNLQVAAQILGECYERTADKGKDAQARLAGALSCYNTGNPHRGFANGYVQRVYRMAQSPVSIDVALEPPLSTVSAVAPQRLAIPFGAFEGKAP